MNTHQSGRWRQTTAGEGCPVRGQEPRPSPATWQLLSVCLGVWQFVVFSWERGVFSTSQLTNSKLKAIKDPMFCSVSIWLFTFLVHHGIQPGMRMDSAGVKCPQFYSRSEPSSQPVHDTLHNLLLQHVAPKQLTSPPFPGWRSNLHQCTKVHAKSTVVEQVTP